MRPNMQFLEVPVNEHAIPVRLMAFFWPVSRAGIACFVLIVLEVKKNSHALFDDLKCVHQKMGFDNNPKKIRIAIHKIF